MNPPQVAPISKVPTEVMLMILARVPYDDRSHKILRSINQYFDDIFRNNPKALSSEIARQQFLHFYQIRQTIVPGAFDGQILGLLWQRAQHLQPWVDLLSSTGPRHVITIGVLLIDVICSLRPNYHRGNTHRATASAFGVSKLVRRALPPQALLLIRYVCMLTDVALIGELEVDLEGELTHFVLDGNEREANRFCRYLLFESRFLGMVTTPAGFPTAAPRREEFYQSLCAAAISLRHRLESPNLNQYHYRAGLLSHLAFDKAVQHILPLPSPPTTSTAAAAKAEAMPSNFDHERDSTKRKLATLFKNHCRRNRLLRRQWQDERKADLLLRDINIPDIVTAIKKEYAEIDALVAADQILLAAEEEMKLIGLDEWPKVPYLDQ